MSFHGEEEKLSCSGVLVPLYALRNRMHHFSLVHLLSAKCPNCTDSYVDFHGENRGSIGNWS